MKKSKIIVPALAVLCLGATASVSGTLAWFSATRTATAKITSVTLQNPEGDLKVASQALKNCKLNTAGDAITMEDYSLRDGSVQLAKLPAKTDIDTVIKVWRGKDVASTGTAGSYEQVNTSGSTTWRSGTLAYAAAFKATFTQDHGSTDKELEFDVKGSRDQFLVDNSTVKAQEILSAYRVGLVTETSFAVWAPINTSATLDYVSEGAKAATGYTNANKSDDAISLGTLTSTGSIDVTVIIWLEGEDPACKTSNLSNQKLDLDVVTSLLFNCKD